MKLLAAVDLSRAASYVVEATHRVAMATDAEVHILHVVIPLPSITGVELSPDLSQHEFAERFLDERDQLDNLVSQLVDAGVNAVGHLLPGDPVKTILSEAVRLNVELIVVGSHGHGPLIEVLVGGVSSGILKNSSVPVLVVPTRGL